MDALLSRLREPGARILWLLHVNADPDCVGSAFALREAFGGVVAQTQGMNRAGERLARQLAFEPEPIAHPQNFSLHVAVDTGSRSSLGPLADLPVCLVDHHRYGDLHERAPAAAWDPARASCAEVVLALLERAGVAPSALAARALLTGIVTDTARFRHADTHALRAAARLVELAGMRIEDVYASLSDDEEDVDTRDARLATLRAAQRAEIVEMDGFLVATSHVGSYDALAANALVRSGADVAVVAIERGDLARMSLRASARVRGLHLGELVNAVGRAAGWSAGGHEGAAGMRGAPPVGPVRERLLAELKVRLEAL